MTRSIATCFLALLAASAPTARAQTPPAAEVMILGTYHFGNPGLDVLKTEVADVLTAEKQAEIRRIVDGLARFRPTKIAVESTPERSLSLDSLYQAYRTGRHELDRDERQQLGFRLAAQSGHPHVYGIDYRGDFPFDAVMEYAAEHDTAFVAFVEAELSRSAEEANRRQRENSIPEILRWGNDPAELAESHAVYMRIARVGAGDSYVGADLLSRWYDRNIRIFTNLQRLAEPGDRILVIYGTGHAPTLRELVTADPTMDLVDPLAFLPLH